MKTAEYLDKVKEKLEITSGYALAKAMDIETQRISDYYHGTRVPDPYACTKIATLLGIDPALVMAEIYEETEKNETKRAFWRDFLSHAGKAAAVTLALTFMLSSGSDARANIGGKGVEQWTERPIIRSGMALVRVMRALAALFYAWLCPNTYSTEKYAPAGS